MTYLPVYLPSNRLWLWPNILLPYVKIQLSSKVVEISLAFPNLHPLGRVWLPSQMTQMFVIIALLALGLMRMTLYRIEQSAVEKIKIVSFLRQNSRGIVLAGIFFVVYFLLANIFNRQDFNTNNLYFAADTDSWKLRLADKEGYLMGMRAVHPLAFLLLRPPIQLISLIFGVAPFFAAVFLVAIIGSISVFLFHLFLLRTVGDGVYAFLFTTLFGVSTVQLLFSSLIETYIFSAFFLILLFVILQKKPLEPVFLIAGGVALTGITVSNLIQGFIGIMCRGVGGGRIMKYFTFVTVIVTILSFVNRVFYPNADLLVKPAGYSVESEFIVIDLSPLEWRDRARLVGGEIFLFSVVAPKPFARTYHRDERGDFPKFNFMQGTRLSRFVGTGKTAVWFWLAIFVAGVFLFVRSLIREGLSESNRFSLAFLGCLGFNFLFHLFYGFEPFLYAANWTYALIFFTALAWRQFAESKIAQLILLTLIGMLTLNNLSFLHSLMSGLSPFIPS